MLRQLKWMVWVVALLAGASLASAQENCGCNNLGYGAYAPAGYRTGHNHYKHWYGHDRWAANCGRGITNAQAAALWGGYCFEDCSYQGDDCSGGGCHSLFGCLKGHFHKACCGMGCKSHGCCAGGGQFGWPTGGGAGYGLRGCCGGGCRLFGHCKAKHGAVVDDCCDDGCGSACGHKFCCKLGLGKCCFGKHGGLFGHGKHAMAFDECCEDPCQPACGHKFCCKLGLGKCCFGKHGGCGLFSHKFSRNCGCSDDYFGGSKHGLFGHGCCFRSHVRGRLTDCCGCGEEMFSPQPAAEPQQVPQPAEPTLDEPVFYSNEKGQPIQQSLDQILDGNEVIGGNYNRVGN